MQRWLIVAGAAVTCASLAGCPSKTASGASAGASAQPAEPPKPDADITATLAALPLEGSADETSGASGSFEGAGTPLVQLGMTRSISAGQADGSARALREWLTAEIGGEAAIRIYPTVSALADALVAGNIDVAWLTPVAYVRAAEKARIKPLVRLTRGGFSNYRSVIFARAGKNITRLEDLRGKRIIWAPQGSASGRLFPLAYLKKIEIDADSFFGQQLTAADHRDVCLAVLQGRADAGATISDEVRDGTAPVVDGCQGAGLDPARFVVVDRTLAIPNDVLAARQDLSPIIESKMREALLGMAKTEQGREYLSAVFLADGFADVKDADFESVREARKLVGDK